MCCEPWLNHGFGVPIPCHPELINLALVGYQVALSIDVHRSRNRPLLVDARGGGGVGDGEGFAEAEAEAEEGFEVVQAEGVGAVGEGFFGAGVDFEEEGVGAGGDGGAGEVGDHFAFAGGDCAAGAGAWELDGVGGVEDDGGAGGLHLGDGAEVVDQAAVAEGGAALGEEDAGGADGGDLGDDVGHVPGGHELAFFHVQGASGGGGGFQEVSLAGEEGGDLEEVDDFGDGGGLVGLVDVGGDGEAGLGFDAFEDLQAFLDAGASEAGLGGAVGFVEGGFEDQGDVEPGADLDQAVGDDEGEVVGFHDAGAGDQGERATAADGDGADLDWVCDGGHGSSLGFGSQARGVERS